MAGQIGFVGIGLMGLPLATKLMEGGHQLRVWNRTASKAEPLIKRGAKLESTPAAAASSGGIVFTMVSDDAALEQVVIGTDTIAHRLAPGGVHVSMSTIAPSTARKLAQYHAENGSMFVSAPVFGRPEAAEAKKLFVIASGPEKARLRVMPLFDLFAQKVFDFGDEAGAALVVKLAGNFLMGAATEALGEALAFAEKAGADRVKTMEMLTQTMYACPVYQTYGNLIAHFKHQPAGFKMKLALKDVDLVLKTSYETWMPMPLAMMVRRRLMTSIAKGRENFDWSGFALLAREDGGLPDPK